MAKQPNPSKPAPAPVQDSLERLVDELRRRGMTEAEIQAVLRKRKRRKITDVVAVRVPQHGFQPGAPPARPPAPRYAPPAAEEVCTVEFAAGRLRLHPKTVLRFIREGRLPAKRIGKSYRIRRADLDAFAGLPPPEPRRIDARVTSVVDLEGVDRAEAERWMTAIPSALKGRPADAAPLSADVIFDPEAGRLKIMLVGPPADVATLLALVAARLEPPATNGPDRG